jgi:predicted DNA repair protein MutK
MDDAGLYLLQKSNAVARMVGKGLLLAAPMLMKSLAVIGTAAMFMVGGGILTHGIPLVHHAIEQYAEVAGAVAGVGLVLKVLTPLTLDALFGIFCGGLALLGFEAFSVAQQAVKGKTQ